MFKQRNKQTNKQIVTYTHTYKKREKKNIEEKQKQSIQENFNLRTDEVNFCGKVKK